MKPSIGIVYIARNDSYPEDVYKVGMTEQFDVDELMNELNQETGLLGSFYALKRYEVNVTSRCETTIYQRLSKYSVQDYREFFKLPLGELVKVVRDVCGEPVKTKEGIRTEWNGQKEDGLYTEYHENGQKILEVPIKDGRKDRVEFTWYESGQKESKGNYKDGARDGLWTWWHENGQRKKEGNHKDGKPDGLWTGWNKNGQKMEKWNVKDGKNDGLWTVWYENGRKWKEKHYKDGLRIGHWKIWLKNGEERTQGVFDENSNGHFTEWYENGRRKMEVNFKGGEKEGLWTSWNDYGNITKTETYKNGELIE